MSFKNFFNVSVCIATYNGEKYILEQINSILNQISIDDEIIVVDDCSKDNTVDVIKSIDDTRIKIVINEFNLGVNCSFENALNWISYKMHNWMIETGCESTPMPSCFYLLFKWAL